MVQYDPFSEQVMMGDPYPIYRQLRDEAPAYFLEKYNAWALSRFEDIWNASLMSEELITGKGTTSAQTMTKVQPVTPMINTMDPPQHTQLRTAIRRFFMPGAVRKLEPLIRDVIKQRFDVFYERGECDLVHDFSTHVATTVACVISGIPLEDASMLNDLVWRFFKRDPEVEGMTEDGVAALMELNGYFASLIKSRRGGPEQDDVLNLLLGLEIDGQKLDDEALGSHLSMLIIGGSETFPKTFANIARRLAENPDARRECIENPALIPDAYHEGLRYDMPTQFLCRTVAKPVSFHGQTFEKDQVVMFLYPSANRDEREFENPDAFDIHRKAPRILTFGQGIHLCLGMQVAKLEGRLCIEALLERMPDYEVHVDRAEWFRTDFVQGFAALPITYTPR